MPYKAITRTLPDGTIRGTVVYYDKKRRPTPPVEHICPHCGRTIFYRFDEVKESYISETSYEEDESKEDKT